MPRLRTRRIRGGAATFNNYLGAAKAGIVQGLRNAPNAVGRALKNSLKSQKSVYSSYASVANMRGSNINNIMSKHNENFRKEAGSILRPYTLAARNKVLAARNSILGTSKGTNRQAFKVRSLFSPLKQNNTRKRGLNISPRNYYSNTKNPELSNYYYSNTEESEPRAELSA